MSKFANGVVGGSCTAVLDNEYPEALLTLIRNARRRCLCSVFIVDFVGEYRTFSSLLDALEERVWLGVDVRIVIGGSRENYAIAERSASARAIFADRGIPCRWLAAGPGRRGSHAKLVVADDHVLVGSHNWSPGAFAGQVQDSIRVASPSLAAYLAGFVNEQWLRAKE